MVNFLIFYKIKFYLFEISNIFFKSFKNFFFLWVKYAQKKYFDDIFELYN